MYLPCIWGHARGQDIDRLQVSQNRAVKLIFCKDHRTNTLALFNELRLLRVREIIKLDSVILILKIKNNLIVTGIELLFNRDIHGHNTRANQHYYGPPSAGNVGQRKIFHTAVIWFNEPLEGLKDVKTLNNFNKQVKRYSFGQRL